MPASIAQRTVVARGGPIDPEVWCPGSEAGNLTNAQFPILNSHPKEPAIADGNAMLEKIALSDQLEERWIDFAACIIDLAGRLPRTFQARLLPTKSCAPARQARPITPRLAAPKAARTLFTKCASLESNSMKPQCGFGLSGRVPCFRENSYSAFSPKTRNSRALSRLPSRPLELAGRFPARMRIEN